MLRNLVLVAVATTSLATASIGLSASAEARPHWNSWRWQPERRCVVKKVWRGHRLIIRKNCWMR